MKKKIIFIIFIVIVLLIDGIVIAFLLNNVLKVEKFNVSEYSSFIEEFSSDMVLGEVSSPKVAKEKAEMVWIEIYGDDVKKKKPYRVSYDESNKVWLVQGSLPIWMLGGFPNIIIRESDGKVLAVWRYK